MRNFVIVIFTLFFLFFPSSGNAQSSKDTDSMRINVVLSKQGKPIKYLYAAVFKNSPIYDSSKEMLQFGGNKVTGHYQGSITVPQCGLNLLRLNIITTIDTVKSTLDGIFFYKIFNGVFDGFFLEKGDDITLKFNADETLQSIEGAGKEKFDCLIEASKYFPYSYSKTLTETEKLNSFATILEGQTKVLQKYKAKLSSHAFSILEILIRSKYETEVYAVISKMLRDGKSLEAKSIIENQLPVDYFHKADDLFVAVDPLVAQKRIRLDLFGKSGNTRFLTDSLVFDKKALTDFYDKIKTTYNGVSRDRIGTSSLYKMIRFNDKPQNQGFSEVIKDFLNIVTNETYKEAISTAYNGREKSMENLSPGAIIPEFENIVDYNGKAVSLKDLKGKVVYVDFWAYWCKGCRVQIQDYAPKFIERLKDRKDVVFVFVSIDEDDKTWKQAINLDKSKKLGLHWKLIGESGLMDQLVPGPISKFFRINVISRAVIIGKDGKLVNAYATPYSDEATYNELINAAGK